MSIDTPHERKPGFIYIMVSASVPYLKIGQTQADPNVRASQLSASTSAATPFYVGYYRRVPNCNLAERAMHAALSAYRVNEGREFFKVSLNEAAATLDALVGGHGAAGDPPTPMAELFNSFDPNESNELTATEQAACRELERALAL